jgi:hypothetical protein
MLFRPVWLRPDSQPDLQQWFLRSETPAIFPSHPQKTAQVRKYFVHLVSTPYSVLAFFAQ